MRRIPSTMAPDHPDYNILAPIRDEVINRLGGQDKLQNDFPLLIREVIDIVIDPVRTGRTLVTELDNVEKTFIGLKVEHLLRDWLDVPKALRDLVINGIDVDVKNTVRDTWTIPPETYRDEEACLLIASEESTHCCWFGLILARDRYLGKPNRDGKRGVLKEGFRHIMWLLQAHPYPAGKWHGIDMKRFRELRDIKPGAKRTAIFFRENLRKPIHRSVIQALLFDQKDYMKRLRGNGGARDTLRKEGIALLSQTYDSNLIAQLGLNILDRDEFIAIDGRTSHEIHLMKKNNVID